MSLQSLQLEYLSFRAAALIFAAAAAFVVATGLTRLSAISSIRRLAIIACRLTVLLLLVLIIGGARWMRATDRLQVVFLCDTSRSTQYVSVTGVLPLQQQLTQWISTTSKRKPADDSIGIVQFSDHPTIAALPATSPRWTAPTTAPSGSGTNVAEAISAGQALFTNDAMHRLVLAWDGNATDGDLDSAIDAAVANHVPIDVVPLRYQVRDAVMIDRIVAPSWKRENEPFTIDVLVRNAGTSTTAGTLTVRDGDVTIYRERADLAVGSNVIHVKVQASAAGLRRYRATFEPDRPAGGPDAIRTADAFTLVRGTGRVLYVDGVEDNGGGILLNALASQGIAIRAEDHVSPENFPRAAAALQAFDAVILSNVSRGPGGLDVEQENLLTLYVRDAGGGLVMIGGPDSFGAGGWIGSPLEKILPVNCSVPSTGSMPVGALAVVLDHSGSMAELVKGSPLNKQQIADEASVLALEALSKQDYFGVLAFDSGSFWAVPLGLNTNPTAAAKEIRSIGPAGGTDICPALQTAAEALAALPADTAAVRHIILLTDGDSQRGDYATILRKMEAAKITLSTVAVGEDADRQLLAALAAAGHGRYYPVSDPRILPRIFVKEVSSLLRPLIVEDPAGIATSIRPTETGTLGGLTTAFPVNGMVLTSRKSSPQVQVPLVAGPKGDPLLASWQIGLGHVSAFTSDATARWASPWMKAGSFGAFWSQVVRSVERPTQAAGAELRVSRDGNSVHVELDANESDGEFANFLSARASATGPDGASHRLSLSQVAPGLYSGDFQAATPGDYVVMTSYAADGQQAETNIAGISVDDSRELRDLQSNEAALEQIAARTGGRVLTPFDPDVNLFSREGLFPNRTYRPLRDLLLPVAFLALLIDVALRRISLSRVRVMSHGLPARAEKLS